MFNYENILAQMKNGTTPEDIAKAFTETLNKAIQKQEEDNKAKEAAAKVAAEKAKEAAAKVAAEKVKDAEAIGKALSAYMKKYHNVDCAPLSSEDVMGLIDMVAGWDIKVKDLGNGMAITMKGLEDSVDKVIDKFFKKYGL